ncbi:MAG: aspartate carbamoyltransferase regulatory subunit [Clostridiales bacterium]|nr:aspartate carbamoyltransferase regulatory subunit [Clostridiales bacterium]MCD7828188.1 aspartate carbamoyltransferase regulatory subunit [Clostridiales bacterium]
MIVNPITDGVVLDHIHAGGAMEIYKALNLDKLGCQVAIIKNAESSKMGRKDILKICEPIDINFDVLGYLDPGVTVSIIRDGHVVNRTHLELPERIEGVIRCRNPRCITSIEQELPNIFKLTDRKNRIYRCIYCESKYKNQGDIK